MGGEDDGTAAQAQVSSKPQAQGDEAAAPKVQVTGGAGGVVDSDDADKARAEYEAALRERDEEIVALEGEITEAAKTAESAEKLRAEMDELRRQGEEQHAGFELQMAGARSVKAARALLADYDNDVERLKAGEPWLFGGVAAAAGVTGLPNADAATDEGAQLKRWRKTPASRTGRSRPCRTASRTRRTTRPSWTRSTSGRRTRRT